MMMIDQINKLLIGLYLAPIRASDIQLKMRQVSNEGGRFVVYESTTPTHDILDKIDRHAGIITRFRINGSLAPVGERVRRLERHLKMREQPPYFWLGAQAEQLALTG